ncbi:MAG: putative molybdenum carrier protein [Gammaproteobacteria bacterium]|nr:putative molybdenum carrier protein [Gammaproteobacteria bacterium]MDH5694307.1 putative molybdenum carrier protein [Gammaproteobacteria bacterium]
MKITQVKIISGGQTGVDRGALDGALAAGLPIGGWCPEGRLAQDGPIDEKYPLIEITGGYRQRTKKNVLESDGTVLIYFSYPVGGTELTLSLCIKEKRPYLLIDADEVSPERAGARIRDFVEKQGINTLNVAGPSGSRDTRGYRYAFDVIQGAQGGCLGTSSGG